MLVYGTFNNSKQKVIHNTVVCTLPEALAGRKAAFSDENDLGPLPHPLVLYLCDLRNKALVRFVPVRVVPRMLFSPQSHIRAMCLLF
jgi:hypothetical protein